MQGKSIKSGISPAPDTETRLSGPMLYVVSTPIGNLGDFTSRAIETLKRVNLILAEDTRSFGTLAKRFGINTRTISFFEHNEHARLEWVIAEMIKGASVALVSDAGTPTISDPGFRLVRECRARGIPVSPVPGACAGLAALSVSGFETDRFYFAGFLPTKEGKRRSALERALALEVTVIFYESPFRIVKTLRALTELGFKGDVFVARELTKLHEECLLGSAEELCAILEARATVKGEIVLLIKGRDGCVSAEDDDLTSE